jgi:hypothetical protein
MRYIAANRTSTSLSLHSLALLPQALSLLRFPYQGKDARALTAISNHSKLTYCRWLVTGLELLIKLLSLTWH